MSVVRDVHRRDSSRFYVQLFPHDGADDPATGLLLARALLAAGNVDGARDVIRQVARGTENLVVGQRELARAFLFAGDVAWRAVCSSGTSTRASPR